MDKAKRKQEKAGLIVFFVFITCIAMTLLPAMAQDPTYHSFADARVFLAIPNCCNVLSNLPFLIVGGAGMFYLLRRKSWQSSAFFSGYFLFFTGIFFTGIGSAYYHLQPDNATLVWDRLPMTIAFMSFFSIIISDCIHVKRGKQLLFPLLFIGIISVYYWQYTEQQGHGDLRLYALVQFLPMLLIPFMLLSFRETAAASKYTWLMLLAYAVSKLLETLDAPVFEYSCFISGHTLKHLFAALAPAFFLWGMYRRPEQNPK
jgi:hypothetical protein